MKIIKLFLALFWAWLLAPFVVLFAVVDWAAGRDTFAGALALNVAVWVLSALELGGQANYSIKVPRC